MSNRQSRLGARIRHEFEQTFRSLRHKNYMLYSAGQLVSLTGTWMQSIALSWITYSLTHSAWLLGLVSLCANLPVLLLSMFGGMAADRYDRRKIIIATQWVEMLLAATLAGLVFTHVLQVWMILVLSVLLGIATAFEMPSRQALVPDLVAGQDMVNAVGINSVIMNMTRLVGPAVGAVLLARFGETVCFALNALSFIGAIYTLHYVTVERREKKEGKAEHASVWLGLQVAMRTPEIRNIIILTMFTSFFGFQFSALLPVFVSDVFHASASAMGLLSAASAVGALCASLLMASRGKPEVLNRVICVASAGVALALLGLALSRSLFLSAGIMVFIGMSISLQMNGANSLLQLRVTNEVRGRVMSIYMMLMIGAVPFGSLFIGHIADLFGAPNAVAVCSGACALASLFFWTRRTQK